MGRKVTAPDGTDWWVRRRWTTPPRFDLPDTGSSDAGAVIGMLLLLPRTVCLPFALAARALRLRPWVVEVQPRGGAPRREPVRGFAAAGRRAEELRAQAAAGELGA